MINKIAKPLKIVDIRNIALFTRKKLLKASDDKCINMVMVLDILTIKFSRHGFNYVVLSDDDSIFEKEEEAKTDITTGTIYFKESVIEQASHKRYCRANFKIAHEIGHFILHRVLNLMIFPRTISTVKPKVFENPEWQADTFASELLMPYEQCQNLTSKEIRRKYHVTISAAKTRYNKIHKN